MNIHCSKEEMVKNIVIQKIDEETYEIKTFWHPSNYMYVNVNDLGEMKKEIEKVLKALK